MQFQSASQGRLSHTKETGGNLQSSHEGRVGLLPLSQVALCAPYQREPYTGNLNTRPHAIHPRSSKRGETRVCLSAHLDLRMDTEPCFTHTNTCLKSEHRPTCRRSNPHLHPGWGSSTTSGKSGECGPRVLRGSFQLFITR